MAMSIQTNVNSLISQENLRVNSDFQSRTIQRLTSGFRINQSGDDAAGLAVANRFRSNTSELVQGVRNANDGISQLQIIDGGLSNVSAMLDRMKTLATQSASGTFTGDRNTLNDEYKALKSEIDRQASNIGLVANGSFNRSVGIYIGGGSSSTNAQVSVDLSGSANQVDATALGLATTSISASGVGLSNNTVNLSQVGAQPFLAGGTQTFTFNVFDGSGTTANTSKTVTAMVSGGATGVTSSQALAQLNTQLQASGISASIDQQTGQLAFSSSKAFTVSAAASTGGSGIAANADGSATNPITATNAGTGIYGKDVLAADLGAGTTVMTLQFTNSKGSASVTLDATTAADANTAINTLNKQLSGLGIYAVSDAATGGVSLQSTEGFTATVTGGATADGSAPTTAGNGFLGLKNNGDTYTSSSPSVNNTQNALAAVSAISTAVQTLGKVQGIVGAGENKLAYAINLAQSQITNFSAAEARIRDTDVASEAANLTKAQVLQQASMAAMAQANSAPQSVLSLLRG